MNAIEKLIEYIGGDATPLGRDAAAEYAELQERLRLDREALEAAKVALWEAHVFDESLPCLPVLRLIEARLEVKDGK